MILQNGDMLNVLVVGAFLFICFWLVWLLVSLFSGPRRK